MNNIRAAFLEAVDAARAIIAAPESAVRWDEPSALAEFRVRGLAGHLARGAIAVVEYLAGPEPAGQPIEPASYFAAMPAAPDLNASLPASIRQRGEALAAAGPLALLERVDTTRSELAATLANEPAGRKVAVFGNQVMLLDDYLVTRIIELLVHTDDLAMSAGVEPPRPPRPAVELALTHLLAVARCRSGDLAVLRAFTRRERDTEEALRIF
jgi:uncharacterized protein (TIGR03083 family)